MAILSVCVFVFAAFMATALAADTISLIAYNDQHGHIEPSNRDFLLCSYNTSKLYNGIGNCPGGFPRISTAVKQWRAANPHDSVFVHIGDEFQGTLWSSYYKGKEAALFDNLVGVEVATLGNHEFDYGPDVLANNYVRHVNFPIVTCNIALDSKSKLHGQKRFTNRPVQHKLKSGVKIGFVGWLTTATTVNSSPGPLVKILEYKKDVQRCINTLHKYKIKYIIGLGHAGIDDDQMVITQTTGLSMVVGGHSHTFMWPPVSDHNATSPPCLDQTCDRDHIQAANYPQIAVDASGRKVPYFQALWGSHYMDTIKATFNKKDGTVDLNTLVARPMLLGGELSDNFVPEDPQIRSVVNDFVQPFIAARTQVAGYFAVDLTRPNSYSATAGALSETLLGDVGTDSMVYYFTHLGGYPAFRAKYGPVTVAITNPGGVRTSLTVPNTATSVAITPDNCNAVFPFGNYILVTAMNGSTLYSALTYGMGSNVGPTYYLPELFAGAQIKTTVTNTFNTTSNKTSVTKVVVNSVLIKNEDGTFSPIDRTGKMYYVVTQNYLNANDQYSILGNATVVFNFGVALDVSLCNYFTAKYPTPATAYAGTLDGRLVTTYVTN